MKEKMQKTLVIIFIGVFCSFIYELLTIKAPEELVSSKSVDNFDLEFHGKAYAIDGDSIKVKDDLEEKNVRLFGIDAPEFKQICFNKEDQEYQCGKISKKFLGDLVNDKVVSCSYQNKDIYNRYLAKCKVVGISINEKIIENGMAIIYDFKQSDKKMIELEEFARVNKIGVWQGKFQNPKDYRKSHRNKK